MDNLFILPTFAKLCPKRVRTNAVIGWVHLKPFFVRLAEHFEHYFEVHCIALLGASCPLLLALHTYVQY